MPASSPMGFRDRAMSLARGGEKPVAVTAADLEISEFCLRRWMSLADVDAGVKPGLSSDERAGLTRLRKVVRVKDLEIESLRRASAYFARGMFS